jgi:hypothetical protein
MTAIASETLAQVIYTEVAAGRPGTIIADAYGTA